MRRLRVWPSTAPRRRACRAHGRTHPLSDLLRIHDASLRAVLTDWLQGCSIAQTLDEALNRRASLQPGEVIYVPTGPRRQQPQCELYAQDPNSRAAGRAQEIEHLTKNCAPRR